MRPKERLAGGLDRAGSDSAAAAAAAADANDAGRSIATEGIEALRELLSADGSCVEVVRLASCQLCGAAEQQGLDKSGVAGSRHETRGIMALAEAVRECRCPLRELTLSANRVRDTEAASLMAAVRDRAELRLSIILDSNAISLDAIGPLRRNLPAGCTLSCKFQQPRCTYVHDLTKASGEHGRVCAVLSTSNGILAPDDDSGRSGRSLSSREGGPVAFLAAAGGDLLGVGLAGPDEILRFEGHEDDVTCLVALNEVVISASVDHTVRLWRRDPGAARSSASRPATKCIATLDGVHVAAVVRVAATPQHIFSASSDGTIGVWDAPAALAGEPVLIAHLVEHTEKVHAIATSALSPGALYSGSADRTIRRWSAAEEWRSTLSWRAHDSPVLCLVSADAVELLCSASEDGRIRLWRVDATQATMVASLQSAPHQKPVRTLTVEPVRGEVLCSGGSDGTVCMWDLRSHMLLHMLRAHIGNVVRSITFCKDEKLCVAGSDARVVVWSYKMDERPSSSSAAAAGAAAARSDPPGVDIS